jgi:hypothetical protein
MILILWSSCDWLNWKFFRRLTVEGGLRAGWNRRLGFCHRFDRMQMTDCSPPLEPLDPLIEAYMKDVDLTLLRANLKLTVQQRFEKHQAALYLVEELRRAGRAAGLRKSEK